MPQDQQTKQAYEQAAQREKEERAEQQSDAALNSAVLHADNHTGQQGVLPANEDALEGINSKEVYDLLPAWHKDDLRRLHLVARGERLKTGAAYIDLRSPDRGALIATGEETVDNEMLVAKHDVDYEIWNKLSGPQK